ncbi:MAG: hypothetical protein L0216_00570 [Planctomycetales bacterium]|nr:hypothetical protein [Planctomycetales bacterium]
MRQHWLVPVLLAAVGAPVFAQEPAPPAPAPPVPPAPAPPKPAAPGPVGEGEKKPVERPPVEIRVITKKGDVVSGYAFRGVLFEKEVSVATSAAKGGEAKRQDAYVEVKDKAEPGAGIRVWYVNNVKGFLFIRYAQIEKVELGRTLGPAEKQALFNEIEAKEKFLSEREEQIRLERADQERKLADMKRALAEEDLARKKGVPVGEDRKKRAELLQKFPPSEDTVNGWNQARKLAIETKFTRLGTVPAAQEQEFLRVYPDWVKAVAEAKQVGYTPPAEAAPAGETPPADGAAPEKPPVSEGGGA